MNPPLWSHKIRFTCVENIFRTSPVLGQSLALFTGDCCSFLSGNSNTGYIHSLWTSRPFPCQPIQWQYHINSYHFRQILSLFIAVFQKAIFFQCIKSAFNSYKSESKCFQDNFDNNHKSLRRKGFHEYFRVTAQNYVQIMAIQGDNTRPNYCRLSKGLIEILNTNHSLRQVDSQSWQYIYQI